MALIDVLAKLAEMHGTTLEDEIAKHNAYIEQRIASGDLHPELSAEERQARTKAVKRRALDKVKAKRAALRASKLKPTTEEIAAKALERKERRKASARRHRVRARDALRAVREKTGRARGGGPQEGVPVSEHRVLTAEEKRARKNAVDRSYRLATRDALREMRSLVSRPVGPWKRAVDRARKNE
ncbi:MAG: hypothetical protein QM780_15755 [Hyphomicrobium sp.]|uniref:hypothetical protein n=1 Tax=Hyphomicrobium sp. TaxID=82 RepID=UPI0039E5789F